MNAEMDALLRRLQANVALFHGLNQGEIIRFLALTSRAEVPPQHVIIRQNETGHEAYVILSGEVEVLREGKRLAKLVAGDIFGELALLDNLPRSATVRTGGKCILLRFDRDDLAKIPELWPKMLRNLSITLANRLRETDELISIWLNSRPQLPH